MWSLPRAHRQRSQLAESPLDEVEPGYARETPGIARGDPAARGQRRRRDQQVVGAYADPPHREIGPHAGVDAGDDEIEKDHGESREHLFDEGLSSRPNPSGRRPVNPMKKLRRGDGCESDLCRPMLGGDAVPVEETALGRNQHAGIDQRRDGDFGKFG
jgi:hypothetical protein